MNIQAMHKKLPTNDWKNVCENIKNYKKLYKLINIGMN